MRPLAALLVAAGLLSGCDDAPKKKPPPPGASTSDPRSSAPSAAASFPATPRAYFAERCATCHGPEGRGDGTAAATMSPRPRSFVDADWQKNVTDDDIRKVVLKGGAAVGKSPLMPPNPELESKPEVVSGLVAEVRRLGKAP